MTIERWRRPPTGAVLAVIAGLNVLVTGYVGYVEWSDGWIEPYAWSAIVPLVILLGLQSRSWVGSLRRKGHPAD